MTAVGPPPWAMTKTSLTLVRSSHGGEREFRERQLCQKQPGRQSGGYRYIFGPGRASGPPRLFRWAGAPCLGCLRREILAHVVALDCDRFPLVGVGAFVDERVGAAIGGLVGNCQAAAEIVRIHLADPREMGLDVRVLGATEYGGEIGVFA